MDKNSKIYVVVGFAIWNNLKSRGYNNIIGRSHKELDLAGLAEYLEKGIVI